MVAISRIHLLLTQGHTIQIWGQHLQPMLNQTIQDKFRTIQQKWFGAWRIDQTHHYWTDIGASNKTKIITHHNCLQMSQARMNFQSSTLSAHFQRITIWVIVKLVTIHKPGRPWHKWQIVSKFYFQISLERNRIWTKMYFEALSWVNLIKWLIKIMKLVRKLQVNWE